MSNENFYNEISNAIVNLDEEKAIKYANNAINENLNLLEVIENGFAAGIRTIGELWEDGEYFLPELMRGAQIMQNCLDLLIPHLQSGSEKLSHGTIVIATIEGDIHSIGKTIVATMLRAYGYEVFDLGADVPIDQIVEVAIEKNADIIGVSALLTTTMTGQKKVIELLKKYYPNTRMKEKIIPLFSIVDNLTQDEMKDVYQMLEEAIITQKESDKLTVNLNTVFTEFTNTIQDVSKRLTEIQKRTKDQLASLKDEYKRLLNPDIFRVSLSEKLFDLKQKLIMAYSPELL